MQSKSFPVLVLILWAATETPLHADSLEYSVKHDHTLGSCQGKLIVSDREIRYEASDGKHAQSWSYMDIQKLDVCVSNSDDPENLQEREVEEVG